MTVRNEARTTVFCCYPSRGNRAGRPYFPTLGAVTSASDMYRVTAIVETGHEGWNSCCAGVTIPASGSAFDRNGPSTLRALAHAPISSALLPNRRRRVPLPARDLGHDGREISGRTDMLAALCRHAAAHQRRRVDLLKTI